MIKIKCLGASHEVGRSGFQLNYNNTDILLDYGLKIDNDTTQYPLRPDENAIIKHMILSHSHLDHCGMIPWLFQRYRPTVYLTAPSLDIADILWEDTLKIARYEGTALPFSKENIQDVFGAMNIVNYKQKIQIAEDISFEMYDAGHIIGSAITKLNLGKKSLIYTGDYKLEESSLHQGADIDIDSPNYLMIESTYGDRDHPKRKDVEKEFIENVKYTIDNGGSVLLPAFAVGRSQELIEILDKANIKDVPIYLDGMGQKVAQIYMKYPGFFKDSYKLKTAMQNAHFVTSKIDRKKATQKQSIIITTAGMLEGGPIMYYLQRKKNDVKSSVFLTGFQMPGTNGDSLLHSKKVDIEGTMVDIKMPVKKFDFSAHIGKQDLMRSINQWNPEKIVCVHGDTKVVDSFAKNIKKDTGIDTVAPKLGDTIKLD